MQGDSEKDGDLRVGETELRRQNQTISKATATSLSWPNEVPYNVYKSLSEFNTYFMETSEWG